MVGAIIGAGLGAAGSIFGGISASKAMKKYRRHLKQQKQENQNWYDRRYNEDATQRADAQRLLTLTEEKIRSRNRAAAGTQAVMGGTEESVAATKAANNEALSDAVSRIAVAGEARKDKIEEQYRSRDQQLDDALAGMQVQKAQNTAQAIQGVLGAAGNIAGALDEYDWGKKPGN